MPRIHPAFDILESFTGLTIGKCGRGIECATSNIRFLHVAHAEISEWDALLATTLIAIADAHHSHMFLYIDSSERCYVQCMGDDFLYVGNTFYDSVERLITGSKCKPMLKPGQQSAEAYGKTYTPDSADIHRYR